MYERFSDVVECRHGYDEEKSACKLSFDLRRVKVRKLSAETRRTARIELKILQNSSYVNYS